MNTEGGVPALILEAVKPPILLNCPLIAEGDGTTVSWSTDPRRKTEADVKKIEDRINHKKLRINQETLRRLDLTSGHDLKMAIGSLEAQSITSAQENVCPISPKCPPC